MNCQNCSKTYNNTNRKPLLLIFCGHSLCSTCAQTLYKDGCVICPECKTKNIADSLDKFPKNLALISIKQTPSPRKVSYRRKDISKREKKVLMCCGKH